MINMMFKSHFIVKYYTQVSYLVDYLELNVVYKFNSRVKNRSIDSGRNIVDLNNDAMRERKDEIAVGREQFSKFLRDLNTQKFICRQ